MKTLQKLKENSLKEYNLKDSVAKIVSQRLINQKGSITLHRVDQNKTDISEIDFIITYENGVDSCYSLTNNSTSTGCIEIDKYGVLYQKFCGWKATIY